MERLQVTHRHSGLRHSSERVTDQRLDARQLGCDTLVVDDGTARNELLRPDGCGVLQHRIREHSKSLGHVPLIDHNPRGGEKIDFSLCEAQRYKERSQAERTNARLKDDYGGRHIRVKGHDKVMSHLMFGILALTANQLLRLLT